jgi:hypothetical protein
MLVRLAEGICPDDVQRLLPASWLGVAERFGLDFHQPGGVKQAGHDDRGRGRPDDAEDLPVRPGNIWPVPDVGQVHPGPDHLVKAGASPAQRLADQVQAKPGLIVGGHRWQTAAGRNRRGPGDQDPLAHGNRPGESEDRFIR